MKGILNFAPIRLNVPPRIPVQDVNLVMELEALSFAITQAERSAQDGQVGPPGRSGMADAAEQAEQAGQAERKA